MSYCPTEWQRINRLRDRVRGFRTVLLSILNDTRVSEKMKWRIRLMLRHDDELRDQGYNFGIDDVFVESDGV